ncbi:hypothetical protein [Laribacter hongkongensis]|uniref:hypothetical protein n=1 Tax=Laribacter hongkongensis TaxID=168471 RepID=UPI001EFEB723|nr:hypothetical protein [Laribacter hongkongensis]MCG9078960.1 hypothetical protein [Laribacter hongkongensis]
MGLGLDLTITEHSPNHGQPGLLKPHRAASTIPAVKRNRLNVEAGRILQNLEPDTPAVHEAGISLNSQPHLHEPAQIDAIAPAKTLNPVSRHKQSRQELARLGIGHGRENHHPGRHTRRRLMKNAVARTPGQRVHIITGVDQLPVTGRPSGAEHTPAAIQLAKGVTAELINQGAFNHFLTSTCMNAGNPANASGFASCKYINLALGIPVLFHLETAWDETPQSLATVAVPPSLEMISGCSEIGFIC